MEELLEDLGDHAIAMYRGDSLRVRFAPKWMDNDEPFLKGGETIIFTARRRAKSSSIAVQKELTQIHIGEAWLELDPIDTKGLEARKYEYDIEVTDVSGYRTTFPRGGAAIFMLLEDVTR